MAMALPTLTGTAKQTAWAFELRGLWLRHVDYLHVRWLKGKTDAAEIAEIEADIAEMRDVVQAHTDADFWIDTLAQRICETPHVPGGVSCVGAPFVLAKHRDVHSWLHFD